MKSSDRRAVYLYGVTKAPGPDLDVVRQAQGVDGSAAIESISLGGLSCWISRVSETDFAANLSKNMENLDWLAAAITRHERAVSTIAQATDILPVRFGVVFLTEASLRSNIQSRRALLDADFKRIQANEEWGVKVFSLPPRIVARKKPKSGKQYLQAKSALLKRSRPDKSDPELLKFAKALDAISEETAEGGKIAAGRRDLEFQTSLLLKRTNRKRLQTVLKSYSKKWKNKRQIECTGPWPPFSFVSRSE